MITSGNCNFLQQYYHLFFQAEDGIRVYKVTGVQTCALPISPGSSARCSAPGCWTVWACATSGPAGSEERRVGKECRSGWWTDHSKDIALINVSISECKKIMGEATATVGA